MKNLIAVLALIMLAQNSQAQIQGQVGAQAPIVAQSSAPQGRKALVYDERTNQLVEVSPQNQAQATATAPSASPIYILNNQKVSGYQSASQGSVQEAPTTVVQEAPVKVSVSDSIRKERQGAETATEDGIVITLEKARMEDEIRRRDRFHNALAPVVPVPAPAAQAPVAVQAPAQAAQTSASSVVYAPQAKTVNSSATAITTQEQEVEQETVVVEKAPQRPAKRKKVVIEDATDDQANDRDYRSEVRQAISEAKAASINLTQYYIAGQVGAASYDTANIRSKLSSGFSLGMVTPERFVFEGSFIYGQSEILNIAGPAANGMVYDIAQYNFSAAVKYQLLPGKLRPAVGALASYTRRSYSLGQGSNGGCSAYGCSSSNSDLGSTDAFDAGLEAGLVLALSNSFSIGADFRYLWNIATRDGNGSGYRSYSNPYTGGVPVVEDLSYYIATLSAKFTF